ncbi:hypothetical protein GWI33_020215 [Rhynchophorus ferrugineus]|uniref:Uncharacterized protein n=1 Tax=Rhynchophorus ferrugineus TaxID=354439 RepID=A0A834HRZ4_RHYFE|nr:hypothetical protein GWI33_020215 [Rhynchophorus ferrugineus]
MLFFAPLQYRNPHVHLLTHQIPLPTGRVRMETFETDIKLSAGAVGARPSAFVEEKWEIKDISAYDAVHVLQVLCGLLDIHFDFTHYERIGSSLFRKIS